MRFLEEDRRRFDNRVKVDARLSGLGLSRLAAIPKPADAVVRPTPGGWRIPSSRVRGDRSRIGHPGARRPGRRSPEDPLQSIAQRSNFRTRMVHLDSGWHKRNSGPILGYWKENNQPVALLSSNRGYLLYDPASGERRRVDEEAVRLLDYHAHVLYRPFPQDIGTRSLLKHALARREREIKAIIVTGICASLFGLVSPQMMSILVNDAIPDADRGMIWQLGAAMLGACIGASVFLVTQAIATLRLQMLVFNKLSTGFWDYALKLTPAFFRTESAGSIAFKLNCLRACSNYSRPTPSGRSFRR